MKAVNHDEHNCADLRHRDALGNHLPRPPYHPTIAKWMEKRKPPKPLTATCIPALRNDKTLNPDPHTTKLENQRIVTFYRRVDKDDTSDPYDSYTVFMPKYPFVSGTLRPCMFYIHQGGPVMGNELFGIEPILKWVVELNFFCVSVNYPLSPEHLCPRAVRACYNVLRDITEHNYLVDQQISAGIDLTNICIVSGQGGAAIALILVREMRNALRGLDPQETYFADGNAAKGDSMSPTGVPKERKHGDHTNNKKATPALPPTASHKKRKRNNQRQDEDMATEGERRAVDNGVDDKSQGRQAGPKLVIIKGMLLYSPMLDYRISTVSAAQFSKGGPCDAAQTDAFWGLFLKGAYTGFSEDSHSQKEYKHYRPGSLDDLDGMPATFIEVRSCEAYRSEAVNFATQMWRRGCDYELHVWAGGSANFPRTFPKLQISKSAIDARRNWLMRTLCGLK